MGALQFPRGALQPVSSQALVLRSRRRSSVTPAARAAWSSASLRRVFCDRSRDTPGVTSGPPSATYFDDSYADMPANPVKDSIQQRHLGLPPPDFFSTSALPWEGVALAVEELRLAPGGTLLDLACGRGGYGIEIATRASARLIGVDFSGEAVRQASQRAARLATGAEFRVGMLDATRLEDGCVDAVLCIDSIQFASDPPAAYAEMRRVIAPGGRIMITSWEPTTRLGSAARSAARRGSRDGACRSRFHRHRRGRAPRLARAGAGVVGGGSGPHPRR